MYIWFPKYIVVVYFIAVKSRIFKLALFIILGAIVNITVAWGCAWHGPVYDRELIVPSKRSLLTPYFHKFDVRTGNDFIEYEAETIGYLKRFADSDYSPLRSKGIPQMVTVELVRAGWPLYCLKGEGHYLDIGQTYLWAWRKPLSSRANRIIVGSQFLPLRPIWPGFAINTIFYAAILWLLTLGPFTARRMIRRKRGRCIQCGYDLRGMDHDKCPECGH